MKSEILSVAWKEWREMMRQRTTRLGGVVLIALFGVVLPLQGGRDFVGSPTYLLTWIFLPITLTIATIADSFAGERERHTLETLLATRLTESEILLGKIGTAVAYALGGTFATAILSLVIVSVATGGVVLPPATTGLAGMAISVGVAVFAASGGVLVSLRASTVRQAQQIMGFGLMLLYFSGTFLAFSGYGRGLAIWAVRTGLGTALAIAAIALLAVDALLLAACRAAFRREKLLLD